ncbi:glycosyltransferase family 4 protein [Paenibacillus sp. TRM 82003]|uniref:glycosyltransferase family 4 protein n=1 Tax=Kineococcus sp. TRM81007 TaxID=2925831 RepID=UPI001F560167|nr:glycosyltransferase family 4 protein [Kineococcus sp. TRM81007]MCI2239665.1 glycosyltransferase family 4 protein [Kineococcus sp. TRM81007]MCI3926771.1 glycosyltransferase family 4 protein [Paenibacillus sp. TRM 82003]
MSTLVVTNDFPPRTGGIESFVHAVARLLPAATARRGGPGAHEASRVVVHTARQRGDAAVDAELAAAGITVVRDPSPLLVPTPPVVRRLQRTAAEHGADRAWFGAAAPLGLAAPALRRAGVRRAVATTHGHEVWWSTLPGSRAALHRIGEGTDTLTYLGPWCRSRIERPLSAAARTRMRRLTPGVDADVFRPGCGGEEVRARHGLGDRPVVVCVSRLVARKGQDVLVRALPEVRRRVPGAALLIVGDGPHRPAVERLVDRLGLRGHVVLTGSVPWAETPAHYDAGDVFCMPTRTRLGGLEPEALGICYLEAAATGLPVVAGDSGGAPDAVLDGVNGHVVSGRDVEAVADRVAGLLADPERARTLGAAGRAWVSRSWGWTAQADRLAALLAGADVPPDELPSPRPGHLPGGAPGEPSR